MTLALIGLAYLILVALFLTFMRIAAQADRRIEEMHHR